MRTRLIHSVQPVQEWFRGPHYDRRTIDHVHRGDSGAGPVVVEQAAQSFASLNNAGTAHSGGFWKNSSVAQTLMLALTVVMGHDVPNSVRRELSPNRISRSRQNSLMLRTISRRERSPVSSPSTESVRFRAIWLIHSLLAAAEIPPISTRLDDNSIKTERETAAVLWPSRTRW